MKKRWVLVPQLALPIIVSWLLMPLDRKGYRVNPWDPVTIDLGVYRHGVQVWLEGGDILTSPLPNSDLVFTYPPFALFAFLPLVVIPWVVLQFLWTAGGVVTLYAIIHKFGMRGWPLSLMTAALLGACEPVRATILLGQINLFLMGLILLDLAFKPANSRRVERGRGILTGLCAAIKLTPGLFGVFLAFAKDWRALRNFVITAGVCTLGAALLLREETIGWIKSLTGGDTRAGNLEGQINQSFIASWIRALGPSHTVYLIGLSIGLVLGVAGAFVAARWYHQDRTLSVCLAAVAGLLASPISWDHHFVWVVPLGFVLWNRALPFALRVVGFSYVLWMGLGFYKSGSPWRGPHFLEFQPWQIAVGAVGPLLGIALLVVAYVTIRQSHRADLPGCEEATVPQETPARA